MRPTIATMAVLVLLLAATGCGGGGADSAAKSPGSEAPAQPASPPQGGGHATAGVVPGSHEDWCDEHGVPESQCTRCDPSLVPAFQAANDWCGDHGLPMSQCTIHDPNLKIVRPPKPEGR